MKKRFKKVVAIVSAIAMVLTSATYLPQVVNADTSLVGEATTWDSWFAAGGSVTSTDASQEVINGSIGDTWWNIQTWLPEVTFVKGYVYTGSFTVTASAPKQFRVDTRVGDNVVFDGDVTVSDWTQNEDGTYSCTYTGKSTEIATTNTFDLRISFGYFDDATKEGVTGLELEGWNKGDALNATVSNFSLTREAVGEVDTDPEVTTPAPIVADEDGFTPLGSGDKSIAPLGVWGEIYQGGSWANASISTKGEGKTFDDLAIKVVSSNGAAGGWGIQAKYPVAGLDAAKTYNYTIKYNASKTGKMFLKLEGVNDGSATDAVVGENTITGTVSGVTNLVAVFELSGMSAGTIVDFVSCEFKAKDEEDTTAPSEDQTTAPEVTKPEMVGNPLVELNDFGNGQIVFVAGLDVIKNATSYNLYVDGTLWGAVTNGQNIPVAEFEAGTHLFQVTGVNDAGESELSTGHTFVIPSGVAVTTYTVTIDGNKVAEVEEGSTYTLGDAKYGYYADGQMYKAGTELTVTGDIALTSVKELSVTMAGGAAIRTSTPAGLKFQATVNSNNAEAVKSDAIKEGMLITAKDIFENNNSVLDLTSAYKVLNIENKGWFDEASMTYCGAVANIVEQNYVREFIARAYVTVTYTDGTSRKVYSDMGSARSVSWVAGQVKSHNEYLSLSEAERLVIDSFIK